MAFTKINSEDRLVQKTFADHLEQNLGWDSIYAWNRETFGDGSLLGRRDTRDAVLSRDLLNALRILNPALPEVALREALSQLTATDSSRSLVQHNQSFHSLIRDGVPVSYRAAGGDLRHARAQVIDFRQPARNRFLAVRELKLTGLQAPSYNRRADIVCFVNGLPLVFIELKAVYKHIRRAYDENLRDYLDEHVIAHAFHHNSFIIVSNGHRARYGSNTSDWEHFAEWKRNDERDRGGVDAERLLDGMLAKASLLDLVENFVLFDASKAGMTRKIIARNHQVLGVNRAVCSVIQQEALKREFPIGRRLDHRLAERHDTTFVRTDSRASSTSPKRALDVPVLAHPNLGKLGVVWHTQGSGKSYSMAFFAEKVRRVVPGNFTFLIMTDRHDLDSQIYGTFVGTRIADENTPRASSGPDLERLLRENHRYVFSLIHKFNQDVSPGEAYSERDDIIVISDEAHRTQAGKLARNMRIALPNASFIGFTGTPLFKHDELTRRIFGDYISRYDFKRSEEDGSTVKLVYENRGEKLGLSRDDLNDRIAIAIEDANLSAEDEFRIDKLLGRDYEIITADARLERVAADFVEHCATLWESGKAMLVCIDKITCARMYDLIEPLWKAKSASVEADLFETERRLLAEVPASDIAAVEKLDARRQRLSQQLGWLNETIIELVISEAQNEVQDFLGWGFDIIPHRQRMKLGVSSDDGRCVDVESAFKDPSHPFRVAIVCAMWLTGFDVESLSKMYLDKPMKAHTLMQAIARANRRHLGKDFGLIVDYNGMLSSLRAALAEYALGDDGESSVSDIVGTVEDRVASLVDAVDQAELHLRGLGFDPTRLIGTSGFARISALADAVEALFTSDEARQQFEAMARLVAIRFRSLLMEPAVFAYAERHDNIEAILKKLAEHRDNGDTAALLSQLRRIVNQAVSLLPDARDVLQGRFYDLSEVDLEQLRAEFAKKTARKATAVQNLRDIIERRLALMVQQNPGRMDYYERYQQVIADYNRDTDKVSIEATFAKLVELAASLDHEQKRAAKEGLTEPQLAIFDLLLRGKATNAERTAIKAVSRDLLTSLEGLLAPLQQWTQKEQTQAEVEILILDHVFRALPTPPFDDTYRINAAKRVYSYVWQQSAGISSHSASAQ